MLPHIRPPGESPVSLALPSAADVAPPGLLTCSQQKEWGMCDVLDPTGKLSSGVMCLTWSRPCRGLCKISDRLSNDTAAF